MNPLDDFCCACISDGECGCEHECKLSPIEIANNIAAHEELMETFFSLELGEKKQVPSTGQWVTLTMGTNPAGKPCRQYTFCEGP